MSKRKGFANLYLVIGIMVFSMIIICLFGYPLINSYSRVAKSVNLLEPYIEARNGLERLYGKFYNNVSYNETTTYGDIGKTYFIVEKEVRNKDINIYGGSGTTLFNVTNKTDIQIDINFTPNSNLKDGETAYYDVQVLYQGIPIYNNSGLSSSRSITIPSNLVYDETTGVYNYGTYFVFVNPTRGSVSTSVSYKEQSYRKVEIIDNDNIKRTLVLKNTTSVDGIIKRYLINNE